MVASAPPVTPPCVEMGWRQEWDNWGFLASILAPVSIRDLVSGNMVESDGGFCLSLAPRPDVQSPRTYVLESTCMCARACAHIYTHKHTHRKGNLCLAAFLCSFVPHFIHYALFKNYHCWLSCNYYVISLCLGIFTGWERVPLSPKRSITVFLTNYTVHNLKFWMRRDCEITMMQVGSKLSENLSCTDLSKLLHPWRMNEIKFNHSVLPGICWLETNEMFAIEWLHEYMWLFL